MNSSMRFVNVRHAGTGESEVVMVDSTSVRTAADLQRSLAPGVPNARLLVDGKLLAGDDAVPDNLESKTVFVLTPSANSNANSVSAVSVAAPAAVESDVVVKVEWNDELRRFRVAAGELTLATVRVRCGQVFGASYHDELRVTWVDGDGDVITCCSEHEFAECVREQAGKPSLRLKLVAPSAPLFKDGPAPQVLGFYRGGDSAAAISTTAELRAPANAEAVAVANGVPKALARFFKDGKILPNSIPEWMRAAVRTIVRSPSVVDLDIDVGALHHCLTNHVLALFEQKKVAEARDILVDMLEISNSNVTWYNLACAHSLLGDTAEALVALKAAVDAGYDNLNHMLHDEDLYNVRSESDFIQIVQLLLGNSTRSQ